MTRHFIPMDFDATPTALARGSKGDLGLMTEWETKPEPPTLTRDQIERAQSIYCSMPKAEPPPTVDGYLMWGDVDGTEEWTFCVAIVRMVDKTVSDALNALASARNPGAKSAGDDVR
jgi:hypothetical protein